MGAGAHLPSGQSCEVDVRPLLLDSFAVCPPNSFCKVEGVVYLAGSAVTGEVEFRNQIGELEVVHVDVWVVLGETFEMVNRPFTRDVIRDHDVANGRTFQHRCNNVIHVYVPGQLSEPTS